MSWRTVVITERAKLDMRMGHIVVRSDEKALRINIDEVSVLIIENPAVSITGCLISALSEKKIKVIFCGLDHNPVSELVPYYGSHDTSAKIKKQINWDEGVRSLVWTQIVAEKIQKQAELLFEKGCYDEAELLRSYINEIEIGDMTNREGHAAKVYFNAIFGMGFTRNRECTTNAALNYGYVFLKRRVFFTVNLRSYINNDFTELFFRDVISRESTLICIENYEHKKCSYETRLIVDNDGCVI